MRILFHSVFPRVGSGYGVQCGIATRGIKSLGHDVAISAYYGIQGFTTTWNGMTVYPAYAKSYGTDTIVPHAMHHFGAKEGESFSEVARRGVVIILGDTWTMSQPLLRSMNVAAWAPIDHETLPSIVSDWFEGIGAIPIAMSRFGERILRENGFNPLYVPHSYDPTVFYPGDKDEARERTGLPKDAFVVAMVAANVGRDGSRKAFFEQISAFKELRRRHSDAVLALHTDVTSPYGVDIRTLLQDLPESSYVITDQYAYKIGMPADAIADIMRSADVLTNCSWGEGFGVCIVEAQACGTPVVVTDTTAMPELVGAGWKVPGQQLWHDSQKAFARQPFIGAISDAYEQAYEHARDEDMRARAWARSQEYDADNVLQKYWVPALAKLEQALEARREEKPRSAPKVVESHGLLWINRGEKYGDAIGWADHEAELEPIIDSLLPEGGGFLDVGAHVGHWSLRLAQKASAVLAVEANPDAASALRRNIALNDVQNVFVVEMAAWDYETTLNLDDPNGQTAGGSTTTRPITGASNVERTAVPAHKLDDVLSDIDRVDLVKLDVEGADLHALRGMRELLAKHRPTLFIEAHDYCGYYERSDLEALLTELGYAWKIAHSYETHWSPDGATDEPRQADYLVCTPAE